MSLALGPDPVALRVTLVPGSAWWTTLRSTADAWPAGDVVELRLDGAAFVWVGVADGLDLTFRATAEQVDAAIAAGVTRCELRVTPAGGDPIPWAIGRVSVRHG